MSVELNLADMIIAEVLARWPKTAIVFHKHNMACVGCAVAPFYTIADAATIYGLTLDEFVLRLRLVIDQGD